MGRSPCCEKKGLKKGQWSPEEDEILVSYIRQNGHPNWRALPKLAGLLRCGKSCRLRWINYLRPDIKRGNFSPEEEDTIIHLHQLLGNRWSAIAAKLPGRTDNEIKNVWHTHLKKRLPKTDSLATNPEDGDGGEETCDGTHTRQDPIVQVIPSKKGVRRRNPVTDDCDGDRETGNGAHTHQDPTHQAISSKKGVRKRKTTKKETAPKRLKSEQENHDDDHNNTMREHAEPSEQCGSEVSIITSTNMSTSTHSTDNTNGNFYASESEVRGVENVGVKDEHFGNDSHNKDDIKDDFWMEMLSIEDTAISTQDVSSSFICDNPLLVEPIRFESSLNGDEVDVNFFWDHFFDKV